MLHFSIVHHNVKRLYYKLREVKLYLKIHYQASTIYCCSETFLNDRQITIEGYNIRRDRYSKEGGVLIMYFG